VKKRQPEEKEKNRSKTLNWRKDMQAEARAKRRAEKRMRLRAARREKDNHDG
jgi:hypothetical protein|tara:strand:- start:4091 stop:4246 length:156 start_codon:yes stop_codon:yes gene_type:complete